MECTCETINYKKCVACDETKSLDKLDDIRQNCSIHRQITICGHPYFVCGDCKQKGWINTHGQGGSGETINNITGEKKINMYHCNLFLGSKPFTVPFDRLGVEDEDENEENKLRKSSSSAAPFPSR